MPRTKTRMALLNIFEKPSRNTHGNLLLDMEAGREKPLVWEPTMVRGSRVKSRCCGQFSRGNRLLRLAIARRWSKLDPVFTETILLDFNDAPRNDSLERVCGRP
jgi:hypothetical protein